MHFFGFRKPFPPRHELALISLENVERTIEITGVV